MMYIDDFPCCCTARLMFGFGQEYGREYYSVEEIIEYINSRVPAIKQDGAGLVLAITTDNQKNAAEALGRAGFYYHDKIKKRNNPDTGDLTLWFMPVHEFEPVKL